MKDISQLIRCQRYGMWGTRLLSEFHADFKSALRFICGCLVFCKTSVFHKVSKNRFLLKLKKSNFFNERYKLTLFLINPY
jgi:hypothetical protein